VRRRGVAEPNYLTSVRHTDSGARRALERPHGPSLARSGNCVAHRVLAARAAIRTVLRADALGRFGGPSASPSVAEVRDRLAIASASTRQRTPGASLRRRAVEIRPTQQRAGAPCGAPGLLLCQAAGVSPALLVVVQSSNQRHHYTDACSRGVLDGLVDDRSGLSAPSVVLERADVLHASAHAAALVLLRCGRPLRLVDCRAALAQRDRLGRPAVAPQPGDSRSNADDVRRAVESRAGSGRPHRRGPKRRDQVVVSAAAGAAATSATRALPRECGRTGAVDLAQLPTAQRASPGSWYPPPSAANRASESSTSARTSAR